jgi:bifunctional DNA-binding transcriptional regulator/antitoxin component of YhaV-PrlF toxin-antitoxin module
MKSYIYKAEEIFKDIEGDTDNVNMIIPPEILESQGWKIGDKLRFEVGDKGTIIITKPEEDNDKDRNVVVIQKTEDE